MTAFRFDVKNNKVTAHKSKKQAGNLGNDQPIFDTMEGLRDHKSINTTNMVNLYNALTNESLARFSGREVGAKRLWDVLKAIPVEASTTTATNEDNQMATEKPAKAPKTPKAPKEAAAAGTGQRGRKVGSGEYAGKTIFPKKEVNPRRANTFGFHSYEVYRGKTDGMPYEDYVTAGGRPVDLRWEVNKGTVEVK